MPIWAVAIGLGLLLFIMLRAQPLPSPAHLNAPPVHVVMPPAAGDQAIPVPAAGSDSGQSVIHTSGTSQGVQAAQPSAAAQPSTVESPPNASPCDRADKPAPMCPVAAP